MTYTYRRFLGYILPSMIAFAFSGVYSIVDGWFIGNYVGEGGLAAINVAYPITALILATGTGLGMGGAILISISRGRDDLPGQKEYLGITLLLLLIAGVAEMVAMYLLYPTLLEFFGAAGEIMTLGQEYIRLIILGTMFQMIGTGLVPIVRNYDAVVIAMVSMVCGFLGNVVLDWLFIAVMGYGMKGAAFATVCGQGLAILPSLFFMIRAKKLVGYAKLSLNIEKIREIIFVGASPFGLAMSPNIVLIIINKNAMIYGGPGAVACYAVVAYVTYIVMMLMQGIGDGSQPLISKAFGHGDRKMMVNVRRKAYATATVLAVGFMALMIYLRRPIAIFFGMGASGIQDVCVALPIFTVGFVFVGFLRVRTSCYYAEKKNGKAYLLVYGELVLTGFFAGIVLPPLMGIGGVWWAAPLSQIVMALLALVMTFHDGRKKVDIL